MEERKELEIYPTNDNGRLGITIFLDESVNNSFRYLSDYGVEVPDSYTKGAYAFLMYFGKIKPQEDIRTSGFIASFGGDTVELERGVYHKNKSVNQIGLEKAINKSINAGLKRVLEKLIEKNYHRNRDILIYLDNKPVVDAYNGEKCGCRGKTDEEVLDLIKRFNFLEIKWVGRDFNKDADKLVRKYSYTAPNADILREIILRVNFLENRIREGSDKVVKDLYHMDFLIKAGLRYINCMDEEDFEGEKEYLEGLKEGIKMLIELVKDVFKK